VLAEICPTRARTGMVGEAGVFVSTAMSTAAASAANPTCAHT
jgi:hypothetical protein